MDTASSRFQRTDGKPLPYADPAGPLRPVKALMAGKAKDVNIHSLHINGQHSGRLGRVYDKQQLSLFAERAESRKIVGVSRQVGGVGTDQGLGIFLHKPRKQLRPKPSLFIAGAKRYLHPRFFQPVQRTQHRIVLHDRRDHMIPRPKKAKDRRIQGFRRIAGKSDLLGIPKSHQLRDPLSRSVNNTGRV